MTKKLEKQFKIRIGRIESQKRGNGRREKMEKNREGEK